MPVSKPTQTIVHRIELQKTERSMLEEYVKARREGQIIAAVGQAAGPIGLGVALYFGVRLGMSAWVGIEAALNGVKEDIVGTLDNMKGIIDDPTGEWMKRAGISDLKGLDEDEFFRRNPEATPEDYMVYVEKKKAESAYKLKRQREVLESYLPWL